MRKIRGKVVWFNKDKGIGVITCNGTNFYAHYSEIIQKNNTRRKRNPEGDESNLPEDCFVTFEPSEERHGNMKRALSIMVSK